LSLISLPLSSFLSFLGDFFLSGDRLVFEFERDLDFLLVVSGREFDLERRLLDVERLRGDLESDLERECANTLRSRLCGNRGLDLGSSPRNTLRTLSTRSDPLPLP